MKTCWNYTPIRRNWSWRWLIFSCMAFRRLSNKMKIYFIHIIVFSFIFACGWPLRRIPLPSTDRFQHGRTLTPATTCHLVWVPLYPSIELRGKTSRWKTYRFRSFRQYQWFRWDTSFRYESCPGHDKPYRFWARYSAKQVELRIGLQKINFGSASMLRPLMWFDQVDPRDPLMLTDGVWGILGRYYFLNNANIWLWGLYGNDNRKGWEIFNSQKTIPEFGGRLQIPVPKGESGFSFITGMRIAAY